MGDEVCYNAAPVETIVLEFLSQLGTTRQRTRLFVLIISTRLSLASARAPADSTLQAMNPSVIFSGKGPWHGKDVLILSMLVSFMLPGCGSAIPVSRMDSARMV